MLINLKKALGCFAPAIATLVLACNTGVPPASTPTPATAGTTRIPTIAATLTPAREQTAPTPTPTPEPIVVGLDSVPVADLTAHSVPLEEVVFDTFDGRFVTLNMASQRLIESLRDAIKPIYNPGYGNANGPPWLRDSHLVIGYSSQSGAYAYPVNVLNSRELVNDVIDGVPVLVSYCPLCASGVVYSREVEGRTLLFGNTSALFQSDLVMFDHQTGSYWFQVLGEAIVGAMTGTRLTPLPSMTITWGEWKGLHPDTRLLVSDGGAAFGSRYASDPFVGYEESLDSGRFPFPVSEERLDTRLRASEIVITAEVDSGVKAYPIRLIGDSAVNDQVGGQPVVIFSRGSVGSAFLATVSGNHLTFQFKDGLFVDQQTGSTWDDVGRSVAGPLIGASLEPVPSRRAFWFSIAGAVPGLKLYRP